MSIWMSAALSAVLFMQPAAPAAATQAAPAEADTTVESLTVTARPAPEKEAIAAFVSSIASETATKRLGRWDRSICPGVVGMRADYAQLLLDRIAATAVEVGLTVGEPGCKPNMVILATPDSAKLTNEMVAGYPDAFAKYDSAVRQSRTKLKAFIASPAPVRWWHVTARTTADGQRYEQRDQIRVRSVSRLTATTRDDFDHVIIILDVSRVGKIKFVTLADYITMVGLAQIDPDADVGGASTVLNLFADRSAGVAPVDEMTSWDRAYLKGLYTARRDAQRGAAQERDMVRSMSDDLGAPRSAEDPKDK